MFIFQALVNEGLLHRDPGLGDGWNCPLPNGYAIIMIDQTDYGWVYNPKTQPFDAVSEQEDPAAGVRKLQLSGGYILGVSLSNWFGRTDIPESEADSFFVLDTQAGKQTKFSSYDALKSGAQRLDIQIDLQPINAVYSKFRFTWFDVFAGIVLVLPLAGLAALLTWWILRLRKRRDLAPQPA